ncbi:trypsin-2-like [Saccoglossus kowalevskii]
MLINDVTVLVAVVTSMLGESPLYGVNPCCVVRLLPSRQTTASCGIQAITPRAPADPSTAIVGGVPANPHSWPWAAQLKIQDYHFCGATLIHPEWVLTAAHCISEGYSSEIQVHLGSHWMNEIDFGKEQQIGVGSVVQHEFYDSTTLENDIAMLKLAEPATSTDYVNIACLPDSTTYYNPGTEGVVVGWGEDNGTSVDNTVLNQVVVPVIDVDICNNTQTMNGTIEDGMFCAGYAEGGKDSCQGDSGGPYQVLRGDGAWELYGVVSWGFGCAEPNSPGVYTHVPTYIDWIYENIAASSNVNVPSLLMLSVMIVWQFW